MPTVRTGDFECHYAEDWLGPPWREPETVVIQHGFGRNGEYWRSWVPDLTPELRVIRRDMRAHGGSTAGSSEHEWSAESLAEDVISFLDAMHLPLVHYVGESVGGITGIVLGALHPERFHTITLVQTPLRLGEPLQVAMRGDFPDWPTALRTLGPGGWVTRNMPHDSPNAVVRARVAWEREQWDRCDADALVALASATPHVDVEHYLERVRVPTLVLAPTHSPLTPFEDQLALRLRIPDAEIEVFEGHGHNVYLDDPHRCTRAVLRYIARVGARVPEAGLR